MITLSQEQLQGLFNEKAVTQQGMNEILTITLNAIMHSERTVHLQTLPAYFKQVARQVPLS